MMPTFNLDGFAVVRSALQDQELGSLDKLMPRINKFKLLNPNKEQQLWFMQKYIPELKLIFELPYLLKLLALHTGYSSEVIQLLSITMYQKNPNTDGTPLHQDARFIPSNSMEAFSVWLPLHNIDQLSAPMIYVPGTHTRCFISQPVTLADYSKQIDHKQGIVVAPMLRGDICIHHQWVLHGSLPNISQHERQALIANYIAKPLILDSMHESLQTTYGAHIINIRNQNRATIKRHYRCPYDARDT